MLPCPGNSLVYLSQDRAETVPRRPLNHILLSPCLVLGQDVEDCTHRDLVSSDDSCQAPGTILDGEMIPYLHVCTGLRRVEHRVCLWKARRLLESSTPSPHPRRWGGSLQLPILGGRWGFLEQAYHGLLLGSCWPQVCSNQESNICPWANLVTHSDFIDTR